MPTGPGLSHRTELYVPDNPINDQNPSYKTDLHLWVCFGKKKKHCLIAFEMQCMSEGSSLYSGDHQAMAGNKNKTKGLEPV